MFFCIQYQTEKNILFKLYFHVEVCTSSDFGYDCSSRYSHIAIASCATSPSTVTPKGVLLPALCNASATRESHQASSGGHLPNQK